jgi:hypothetical protein
MSAGVRLCPLKLEALAIETCREGFDMGAVRNGLRERARFGQSRSLLWKPLLYPSEQRGRETTR